MRSTHLRAARPIADELSKGQKLEHGAVTDIFLEHAIRGSYGIDKCVLIPHWDRKPRIARMARHENAELFASSQLMSARHLLASAVSLYSQYP